MVTPPQKAGERGLDANNGAPLPLNFVSADGQRATASLFATVLTFPTYSFNADWEQFGRTAGGWTTTPLQNLPNLAPSNFSIALDMIGSDSSLSQTLWTGNANTLILPGQNGSLFERTPGGAWSVAANEATGQVAPDGSRVLTWGITHGLEGPADPSLDQLANTSALYDYSGGADLLVDECTGVGALRTQIPGVDDTGLESGQACPTAAAGRSEGLISPGGALLGGGNSDVTGVLNRAVSSDGSRVFFTSPDPSHSGVPLTCSGSDTSTSCPPQLYVGQYAPDGSLTNRWISRSQVPGQAATLMARAVFEGASADGSKVFFRTDSPLTADDPNGQPLTPTDPRPITTGTPSPNSWDLYEYDLPTGAGADPGSGSLTRLSGGPTGDADPNVACSALDSSGNCTDTATAPVGISTRFISNDGSRVYFVTAGPIDGVGTNAAPTDGTSTTAGGSPMSITTRDLYLYDANKSGAARWEFIAQIPFGSTSTTTLNGSCASAGGEQTGPLQRSNQTGIGTSVIGSSDCVRGTADGTEIAFQTGGALVPGATAGTQNIYVYNENTDTLSLVSAPQDVTSGRSTSYTCGGVQCNGDFGAAPAAPLPPNGEVFFESKRRLLPQAVDGVYAVYEWRNGQLSLISPADSPFDAVLSGNSADGSDVFFATNQQVLPQDVDEVGDIYDARVDGGFPPPSGSAPACDPLSGACQAGATAPPSTPTSATVTFTGPGNQLVVPAPAAKVKLGGKVVKGFSATIKVRAPGKGALNASGRGLRSVRKAVSGAGTYQLRLSLSAAARRTLGRKHRFATWARALFSPSSGGSSSATVALLFKSKPAAKRKGR